MIEKEIEKYFNERLENFKKALYEELLNMFGLEYEREIKSALNIMVAYKVSKDDLEYYEGEYDNLTVDEQQLVDYLKDKLEDNDNYILGSSSGIITDVMRKEAKYAFYDRICFCSILPSADKVYQPDEIYALVLCYKVINRIISFNHILSNKIDLEMLFCKTLGVEIINRLHLKGYYFFGSEEFVSKHQEAIAESKEYTLLAKAFKIDRYLLTPFLRILPLCFKDYELFVRKVGKENFESFINAFNENNGELVYEAIEKMQEEFRRNDSSEVVIVDVDSVQKSLDSYHQKQTAALSQEESKTKVTKPAGKRRTILYGLDLGSMFNKKKFNNINNDFFNIGSKIYGTDYLYIDEDGKDTPDLPGGYR